MKTLIPDMNWIPLAAALGIGLLTATAQAEPQSITYRFTGKVRPPQSPPLQTGPIVNLLPGLAVKEGDVVTGSFTYTRNYRQDLDPGPEYNYNFETSMEVNINGHHLTQSKFVSATMDSATYFPPENADLFGISWWWGTEWDVLLDSKVVTNPAYYWMALELTFIDSTGKALPNGDFPAALNLAQFDYHFGSFTAYIDLPAGPDSTEPQTRQDGFEFSVDTIERVEGLRTSQAITWNPDASGYLEVSSKADGPYNPYLGDIANLNGLLVALVNPDQGNKFYRLSGPAPGLTELDNFDTATPGTAPDVGQAVGPWQFPDRYVIEGIEEPTADIFSIVPTASFDPTGTGNSLRVQAPAGERYHLAGLFNKTYHEVQTPKLLCRYDLFVPEGTNAAVGTYLGGDNASGGWSNATDRGAMLVWGSNNKVSAVLKPDQDHPLGNEQPLADFPRGTWLTVEIHLDLLADTYSVAFGPRGSTPVVVGSNIPSRSGPIRLVDRFGVMPHPSDTAPSLAYLDNVSIRPEP